MSTVNLFTVSLLVLLLVLHEIHIGVASSCVCNYTLAFQVLVFTREAICGTACEWTNMSNNMNKLWVYYKANTAETSDVT